MSKSMKTAVMVGLLSIVSCVIATNWYVTGNPSTFFLYQYYIDNNSDNIEKIGMEFENSKVYLNVHLKKPATCKAVIKDLGIGNINIAGKTYAPKCDVVDSTFIRIIYTEAIVA